jgi:hypothetical protein
MTSSLDHLVLRQHAYAAQGEYAQACAAYWAAVGRELGPGAVGALLQMVRDTATELETAIRVLLAYLESLEQTEQVREEHERNETILRLLARELNLLPAE